MRAKFLFFFLFYKSWGATGSLVPPLFLSILAWENLLKRDASNILRWKIDLRQFVLSTWGNNWLQNAK